MERVIGATGLRPIYVGDTEKAAVVDGVAARWLTLPFEQRIGRGAGVKTLTR